MNKLSTFVPFELATDLSLLTSFIHLSLIFFRHLSFPSSLPDSLQISHRPLLLLASSLYSFLLFSSSFLPIFLVLHWQRFSSPPLTQKQAQFSWQPSVVHMKRCTFTSRCPPLKTATRGLTGTVTPETPVIQSTAQRPQSCLFSLKQGSWIWSGWLIMHIRFSTYLIHEFAKMLAYLWTC